MTWQGFYLVCFVVGFSLAALAFLSGVLHWPIGHHLHAPQVFTHGGHAAPGAAGPAEGVSSGGSPFNFASFMAFLAWFGGVGYLLTASGGFSRFVVLALAGAAGTLGATIVFVFVAKVLLRYERVLRAADFDMVGVLGRLTVPIREGGTGEVVYSQESTRRSAGARSDTGQALERGAEVIVTRYERGIAYVRLWEELAGAEVASPAGTGTRIDAGKERSVER